MDCQGRRIAKLIFITTVAAALGEKEILLSQTIGSYDNVTCGTKQQPCATFNYALSLFSKEGGILVIDGGSLGAKIKPYVFNYNYKDYVINGSLIVKKRLHQNHQSLSPVLIINNTMLNKIIFCSGNLTIISIVLSSAIFRYKDNTLLSIFSIVMQHDKHFVMRNCLLRNLCIRTDNSMIVNSNISSLFFCKTIRCRFILNINNTIVKTLTYYANNTSVVIENAMLLSGVATGIVSATQSYSKETTQFYIRNSSFRLDHIFFTVQNVFLHQSHFIGIYNDPLILVDHLLGRTKVYGCSFSNIPIIVRNGHSLIIINSTFENLQKLQRGYPALYVMRTTTLELVNSNFINNTAFIEPSALSINVNNLRIFNVSVDDRNQKNERYEAAFFVHDRTSINGRVVIDRLTFLCYEIMEHSIRSDGFTHVIRHTCKRCPFGSYSLYHSVVTVISNEPIDLTIKKCHQCPFGGVCNSGIQAKDGYWGFVVNLEIVFLRCPAFYCYSTITTQKGYNTCAPNRIGRLCSLCKPGFTCNSIGKPTCISNRKCGNLYINIFLYLLTVLFCLSIIMYIKEIILFSKRIIQKCQLHRKEELTENESDVALDELLLPECPYQILPHTNIRHIDYVSTSCVISGTMKVLFFFYQAVSIIRVDTSEKSKIRFPLLPDTIATMFNLRPEMSHSTFSICFMPNLQNFEIQLLKHGIILAMLGFIQSCLVLREIYKYCRRPLSRREQPVEEPTLNTNKRIDTSIALYCNLPFWNRIKCAYVQILLIGYAGISTFALQSVHCVEIDKKLYLFTQASIKCYQPWQIAVWVFICVWIIPYPIVVYYSCELLYHCLLTPDEFLLVLTFPPLLLYKLFTVKIRNDPHPITTKDAMLSRHLLMVINEPFREIQDGKILCWEATLMLMRVVLVAVNTFMQSPMHKIFPNVSLFLLFLTIHLAVMPFKDTIVNTLEKASLFFLISLSFVNNFWAFTNEYNLMASKGYRELAMFFLYYELFVLLLPFLALVATLLKIAIVKLVRFIKLCSVKQD